MALFRTSKSCSVTPCKCRLHARDHGAWSYLSAGRGVHCKVDLGEVAGADFSEHLIVVHCCCDCTHTKLRAGNRLL
jgi:hypothetical protein